MASMRVKFNKDYKNNKKWKNHIISIKQAGC